MADEPSGFEDFEDFHREWDFEDAQQKAQRRRNQQGQGNKKQGPWDAMQPILPAVRKPTVQDVGMANADVQNRDMLRDVLGSDGFMTGSGTKDSPYQYHPGQKSAHERMVGDVNDAWSQYAYQQGRHNTIKMILDKVFG